MNVYFDYLMDGYKTRIRSAWLKLVSNERIYCSGAVKNECKIKIATAANDTISRSSSPVFTRAAIILHKLCALKWHREVGITLAFKRLISRIAYTHTL